MFTNITVVNILLQMRTQPTQQVFSIVIMITNNVITNSKLANTNQKNRAQLRKKQGVLSEANSVKNL